MPDKIDKTIKDNASGPRKASGDSLQDQIAADKYLESKKAARSKGLGIKLTKISPGGTA